MPFMVNPFRKQPSIPEAATDNAGTLNLAFVVTDKSEAAAIPADMVDTAEAAPLPEKVPISDLECVLVLENEQKDLMTEKAIEALGLPEEHSNEKERKEDEDDDDDEIESGDTFAPWDEASLASKIGRIVFYVSAPVLVLGMLYFFICALDILTAAFRLVAGRIAGEVFSNSVLLNNPVCGLMIGVLVTVLVQSSSTSSSIIVSLVASGVLGVRQAIPIIMGANIGTTITSVLVSITQSHNRKNFQRSFAGATVHDMFNWCCVIILLPIEVISGYLFHLTSVMTKSIGNPNSTADSVDFLKVLTTPLTSKIIKVDSGVINAIAEGSPRSKYPMIRNYCPLVTKNFVKLFHPLGKIDNEFVEQIEARPYAINLNIDTNGTLDANNTVFTWNDMLEANSTLCGHAFAGQGLPGSTLSELAVGLILLFGALFVIITCLIILVKVLGVLMKGPMARAVRKVINADFPGCFSFLTGYVAILLGGGLTILVQSSSVFISTLTPLVGIGLIEVDRMFPLALGSNLGTTITGILAALTADADRISNTMQVALCHLFFNITGIIIFYPIPFMRKIPIKLAKFLGRVTGQYRWFAVVYVLSMFLLLPVLVFGLSVPGWYVLVGVGVPIILFVIAIGIINVIQTRRPQWLPSWLRTWDFLPEPLRSLEPYDRVLTGCCNGKCCKCCGNEDETVSNSTLDLSETSFSSSESANTQEKGDDTPRLSVFVIPSDANSNSQPVQIVSL